MADVAKVQLEALAALNTWRKGHWVSTAQLNGDGVTLATLRALSSAGLVDSERTRTAKYWQITDAGRQALISKEKSP